MGLLGVLLIAVLGWLLLTGRLQRMTAIDGIMVGLAIIGAVMLARGRPIVGAVPLLIAAGYSARRRRSVPVAHDSQAVADARALLGLDDTADEAAIRAAHRRLIARTHPDAGGTQALAEKINEARNILLRHTVDSKGAHTPPTL
ncbi:MAG: molecular chaperone DnaJ [Sphingobium sp.]